MRDCDLLAHELDLAAVIPGVLGADAVDLEVVLGREAEPKAGKFKFKFLNTNFFIWEFIYLLSGVTIMLPAVRTSLPFCQTRT